MRHMDVTREDLAVLVKRCADLERQHEADQQTITELTKLAWHTVPDDAHEELEDGRSWKDEYARVYASYRSVSAQFTRLKHEERAINKMLTEMSQEIADLRIKMEGKA